MGDKDVPHRLIGVGFVSVRYRPIETYTLVLRLQLVVKVGEIMYHYLDKPRIILWEVNLSFLCLLKREC